MTRIAAIVQARMSSTRLPGKVLRPLAGRPALAYLLERLAHAGSLDGVVVATSTDPSDDPVAAFCAEQGVACRRGPLEDVAERFRQVVDAEGLDAFVRVNGDSPLLDQRLVDRAVGLYRGGGFDLVTNVFPRTFPPGESVEVVSAGAFERMLAGDAAADEREHVTLAFYRRPEGWRIHNFAAAEPAADARLTLDTEDDAARLDEILSRMERPHWQYGYDDVLGLLAAAG